MKAAETIQAVAGKLRGRLGDVWIDSALSYIEHSEVPLALEVLCEQLYEFDVSVTSDEKASLKACCTELRVDLGLAEILRISDT